MTYEIKPQTMEGQLVCSNYCPSLYRTTLKDGTSLHFLYVCRVAKSSPTKPGCACVPAILMALAELQDYIKKLESQE